MRTFTRALVVAATLLCAPALAFSQATLTGVVEDPSGAVLPGVTVEAKSPALIERVRSTTTDSSGRYRISDLPAGTYELSFALDTFATVKRADVVLEGTFTATINTQMKVGGIEQVVVVTAESPIVNISSAKQEDVVRREDITALPIARDYFSIATLVPGMVLGATQDIGGLSSTRNIVNNFSAHGGASAVGRGTEGQLQVDGLSTGASALFGTGSGAYMPDISNAAEISVVTSGGLGSTQTGGPVINVIPRSGGNTWAAQAYYNYSNDRLQDRNIGPDLKARNAALSAPVSLIKAQDFNISGGGPIQRNRVWFWTTARWNLLDQGNGMYRNRNAGDPTKWTIDLDPNDPSFDDTRFRQFTERITWQATAKNKITGTFDRSSKEIAYKGGGGLAGVAGPTSGTTYLTPEAAITSDARPQTLASFSWQNPRSNRMLLDAGFSWYYAHTGGQKRPDAPTSLIDVVDNQANIPLLGPSVSIRYRSPLQYQDNTYNAPRWKATMSYSRWNQNLRVGYDGIWFGEEFITFTNDESLTYNFSNGVPTGFSVRTVNGYPGTAGTPRENWTQNTGLYLEDSWTHHRLTLQGAVRYDYATSGNPDMTYGPGKYFVLTPVTLPKATSVSGYHDITPRMGLAYDVFGNGKTSLKFNYGKYLQEASNGGIFNANNVSAQLAISAYSGSGVRSWADADGDYAIDCDITNPAAQGPAAVGVLQTVDSCGAVTLTAIGTPTASTNKTDPALLHGWGVRPYDHQIGIAVQQEVLPRFSVEVGYRRRWFGNFTYTNNFGTGAGCGNPAEGLTDCVQFGSYQEYSLIAPSDSRLVNGGGYVINGLYDPAATFGTNSLTLLEDEAHQRTVRWQGVDVNLTARMKNGLILRGGFVQASTLTDTCKTIVDNPEGLRTCRNVTPWATNAKFSAIYVTPKLFGAGWTEGFTSSIVLNARPLSIKAANYPVPNTVIQAALAGRLPTGQLSNGNTTKNILTTDELVNPDYLDTQWNADLRVSRILRLAGKRVDLGVDLFNFLNLSSITGRDVTFNTTGVNQANWLRPTAVESARFAKFYVQFDF